MKKIGVLTFSGSNYGSVLQCYSTLQYLEKLGFYGELIEERYRGTKRYTHYIERLIKIALRSVKIPGFFGDYRSLSKSVSKNNAIVSAKSMEAINGFVKSYLNPRALTYRQLINIAHSDDYFAFIAGSDQIWNCSKGMLSDAFFLKFAPIEKRIALCPSFGTDSIQPYIESELIDALNGFRKLSIREKEGAEIIYGLTGRKAERLPDPTLLLTPDEWRDFAECKPEIKDNYILLHFLNMPNSIAIDLINDIAVLTSKKVICFATKHKEFEKIEGIQFVDGDPKDYVKLIDGADLVCSDSFHTTMFSINLSSNFLVFDRQYLHGKSQLSRIKTVLSVYGYENHFVNARKSAEEVLNLELNKAADNIRKSERAKIINYLNNELTMGIE